MIEFIIPSFGNIYNLRLIINCLILQTSDQWCAHIILDGKPLTEIKKIIEEAYDFSVDKFRFTSIPPPNNVYGHTARNYGKNNSLSNADWMVMTGEDNYYIPTFVQDFLSIAYANPLVNFIYSDFLLNTLAYHHLNTKLCDGLIDIGCFMTRSKYAKNIDLNITSHNADWLFIDQYLKQYCSQPENIFYIQHKVLYVHN